MRPLSIRSPEGIAHEKHTERAWLSIVSHFPGGVLKRLGDTHSADGIIERAGKPIGLVEVKSRRDFDEHEFLTKHRAEWLITAHKIDANVPIARQLGCPFYGAMHIIQSRVVYLKTIWRDGVTCKHFRKEMRTQARIDSDETIVRPNAFIPMGDAWKLRY